MDIVKDTPLDQYTYEQAFEELESIVASLESGEHELETSLSLFARGQALARYCSELLDKAEQKLSQLSGDQLVEVTSPAG